MGEGQDEQSKEDTIISIIEQGPLPELVVFDLGTYQHDRRAAEPFLALVVLSLAYARCLQTIPVGPAMWMP